MARGREIAAVRERLARLEFEKAELQADLERLLSTKEPRTSLPAAGAPSVTNASSPAAKIALFRSLFRGRDDVFPKRWENTKTGKAGYAPACANEWTPRICGKPKVKCGECPHSAFLSVSDDVIGGHLRGHHTVGVYPLLLDDTCWFLAVDFDQATWINDSAAFLQACAARGIPAALERSRSGQGAHVWVFFVEPVPATIARRLGAHLITEAMERNPDIGFSSYDRFFPSQDSMPAGGFGNLIALPLQHGPRSECNSLFLDEAHFEPHTDQWAFLATVRRITLAEATAVAEEAGRQGRVTGLRLPLDAEDDEPWAAPPSRRRPEASIAGPLPTRIEAVLADQIYIQREGLPSGLVNRIVRLAAFQNPAFYSAQAMRLSTFGIPRIVACAELLSQHIALPRGCREEVEALTSGLNVELRWRDERNGGHGIDARFLGTLTKEQQEAASALLLHDNGVLAATTGFGKTVVAAAIVAVRRVSTLILVHRRQLMEQWASRLQSFLRLPADSIGQIGGGARKPTGIVDIATIQSLTRSGIVDDLVAEYGQLIVDECHHLSAVSFEAVARRAKARFVLGLSATVTRKDGHHPIIFMQCGPIRFRVDARSQVAERPFSHRVVPRRTSFALPAAPEQERQPIQQVYAALAADEARNALIFNDVLQALEDKRSPVILTERRDHALLLAEKIARFARNVIVLTGGVGARQRRAAMQRISDVSATDERVLIATGRYLGEGFDDARLDTLFLVMPISWRGTLEQYVGRLHRSYVTKREVTVYDYVDEAVPVLKRMSEKRFRGYRSLGYWIDKDPTSSGASAKLPIS
ncbi:TOTE conflict system archaeo-eukaryotic primase domain-containing protein [Bradyrhizobium oligotrophicum]|uniref:TOTE conflict system archaeo-eukaryotic primase domain-containing protein n=1 Tax=Bradyrhizobium oligotrophicum TaxID=44255 RepID=UPI003EBFA64A